MPFLFSAVLTLVGKNVPEVLHMACAGELQVTAVEGRRSTVLGILRPPDRLPDTVVGGPLDNDEFGDRKNR